MANKFKVGDKVRGKLGGAFSKNFGKVIRADNDGTITVRLKGGANIVAWDKWFVKPKKKK